MESKKPAEEMELDQEAALFRAAAELPANSRTIFLDGACHGDLALRTRLEVLFKAHEDGNSFLEPVPRPSGDDLAETLEADQAVAETDEAVGQTIDRYKLLEKVGEGGCGVVYVAEQTEPVRRRVALKVIKLGMDTKAVVARFQAERQALAMMDHPNIAKVLDAGTTGGEQSQIADGKSPIPAGRPYFVMELVRGIKITQYSDQTRLSTRQRLDLFIKVCHAIQHAHQKGIIHRDIKPSNILVTLHDGVPIPKVIDFGIAKATEGRLTDATVYTQLHQFIGTPAYMSPEQAEMSGLDIDTRSDIYSLGVLLYELLAGSTPFDAKELMASGVDVMRKTIREKEPERPSSKLATLQGEDLTTTAKGRSVETSKLVGLLRGDLDWVVMKCLEKDRSRRYDTAHGLAADLGRYLVNEPVVARPPSATYRFQKLLRRNKVIASSVTLVLAAILVGTVVSIGYAVRASKERDRALAAESVALDAKSEALEEKANAQGALHFIQDDVLSQASPGYQPDRELTVRALLDRVSERIDSGGRRPPLVEASIRQTIASVYTELADYPKAVQHYEKALALQHQNLGESHPDALRSLSGLAMTRWWSGDFVRAAPLTREGLERSLEFLPEKDPITLRFMQARAFGRMLSGPAEWADLEPFYLQALASHREVFGHGDQRTLRLIYGLGLFYTISEQIEKAEPLLDGALERSLSEFGEMHPQTADLLVVRAVAHLKMNEFERAEAMFRRCRDSREGTLGEEHPQTVVSILQLARAHVLQGQFEEAEPLVNQMLDFSRRLTVEDSPWWASQLSHLGRAYFELGQLELADKLCTKALDFANRKPGNLANANPAMFGHLGAVRLAQKRSADAETLLRQGLSNLGTPKFNVTFRFVLLSLLGESLSRQMKFAEAEPLLLEGFTGLQKNQATMSPIMNASRRTREVLERLVRLYEAWGKPDEAAGWKAKLADFEQIQDAKPNRPPSSPDR